MRLYYLESEQKLRIVQSESYDPYYNLALEESLFHHCENTGEIILYLWQNNNTIVVGRNQTVFTECNLGYAQVNDTKIARRMTGGGAVYHDLGNLNFTIIVPIKLYHRVRSTQVIIDTLLLSGVKSEVNGRNDIFCNGKKISGNAYYSSKKAGLHHGTLLVEVDLLRMEEMLNVSGSKVSKSGVSSIRSRVMNIHEVSDVSIKELQKKLEDCFIDEYGSKDNALYGYAELEDSNFQERLQMYSSEAWIMNQVSEYSIKLEEKFLWGNVTLSCEMEGKKIQRFAISSDSLYPDTIDYFVSLCNQQNHFSEKDFLENLGKEEKNILYDLQKLKIRLIQLVRDGENEKN